MEQFFGEHWEIASSAIGLLLFIVGYFVAAFIKRVDRIEMEVKEIKMNYLKRFEDIKSHMTSESEKTQSLIAELSIKLTDLIARQEAQTAFCKFVQDQKDK